MERMLVPLGEIKFANADNPMEFTGYGAVFGNVDAYGDVIQPGAFADTLASAHKTGVWPSLLSQHGGWGMTAQDMTPVGVLTDLSEDGIGLKTAGVLAPTPRSKPEEPRRLLKRVDLIEISLVTFPANGKARVLSVKSFPDNERDLEAWLMRDAGLSRKEAQIVIGHGFKAMLRQRDAADEGTGELSELAALIQRNTAVLAR